MLLFAQRKGRSTEHVCIDEKEQNLTDDPGQMLSAGVKDRKPRTLCGNTPF